MKIINSIILMLCIGIISPSAFSQQSSFKKLDPGVGSVIACSPSGEYVIFASGQGTGALWERSKDKYTRLDGDEMEVYVANVNDSGIVVGAFQDPAVLVEGVPVLSAGYWEKGKWYGIPYPDGHPPLNPEYGSTAWGITADCSVITGQYYLTTELGLACNWKKQMDGTYKFDRQWVLPKGWGGHGGRPNNIAGNGSLAFGWVEKDSADVQWADRTPAIFGNSDTAEPIFNAMRSTGEFYNSNYEGTIIGGGGAIDEQGLMGPFIWEKNKGLKWLGLLDPAHLSGNVVGLSETGVCVGYTYELMPDSRRAFLWSEETGMVNLYEYAQEVYGLSISGFPFMQANGISANGKIIYGIDLAMEPFMLVLDGPKNFAPPTTLNMAAIADGRQVLMQWTEPLPTGHTLLGYNVYRSGTLITPENLSPTVLTFIDSTAVAGNYCYAISAVFENEYDEIVESAKTKAQCIQVLDEQTCYPVRSLDTTLLYNQVLTLNWSVPTPYISGSASEAMYAFQDKPDTVKKGQFAGMLRLNSQREVAIAYMNNSIYTGTFIGGTIYKYDLNGWLQKNFVSPLGQMYEMTSDGSFLYAVNNTDTIYKLEIVGDSAVKIADKIKIASKADHISYVPILDENRGGFEYGSAVRSLLCKMDGSFIDTAFNGGSAIAGTAYYEGDIYVMEQFSIAAIQAQVDVYSLATKQYAGLNFPIAQYPEFADANMGYGAGMTTGRSANGAICVMAILQLEDSSMVVMIEVDKPTNLLGYDVYKNDVRIAENYPYRNYQEILEEEGSYTYHVRAKWQNGLVSTSSPSKTVVIQAKGECNPPLNVEGEASFNHIALSWEAPILTASPTLVGFFVFDENGNRLNEKPIEGLRYTPIVKEEGTYFYTVKAFYSSACEASAKPIEVEVNYTGKCMPVNNLIGTYNPDNGATLNWELPYFDSPIAMRYDNGIFANGIGSKEGGTFWAAIGWLKNDISLYKNFTMVGMEAFIATRPRSIAMLVIVDDVVVRRQSIAVASLKIGAFNYFALEKPIAFSAPNNDFAIALEVDNVAEDYPLGVDQGPAVVDFGDLISFDEGKSWETLLVGNWLMAAYISQYRDLSAMPEILPSLGKVSPFVNRSSTASSDKIVSKPMPYKAESKALELKGFKVYKEGTALTQEPINVLSFNDPNVTAGASVNYQVASVWNTCDEIKTDYVLVCTGLEDENSSLVNVYPNPVRNILHLQITTGSIENVRLLDVSGREIYRQKSVQTIDVSSFKPGLYFLRVETKDKVYTKKINIVK